MRLTDPTLVYQRDGNSGTQRMIAAAIGVEANRFKGVGTVSSTEVKTKVSASLPASPTIGILATDVADDSRDSLRELAFQAAGGACGYYPDRSPTSFEKSNVRKGNYTIWGPLHLLTPVASNGLPSRASVRDIVSFMTGTKVPPPGLELVQLYARKHVIPQCAMEVKRTQEMGPLIPFVPERACGCAYDQYANGKNDCTPCTSNIDCPASTPICSYRFCERS